MKIQICFLLAATVAVMAASPAEAAMPGQPCKKVGVTKVSDNQQDMVACLYDGAHHLIWKSLIQPAAEPVTPVAAQPARTFVAAAPVAMPDSAASAPAPVSATRYQDNPLADAKKHWQGWYAGVDAGIADTTNSFDALANSTTRSPHMYGAAAGVVGGYNWIRNNGLFYGGEADINYMSNVANWSGVSQSAKSAWKGYATVRGRVGMAFDPALIFLTGGLALADIDNNLVLPTTNAGLSSSGVKAGWTVGAGG